MDIQSRSDPLLYNYSLCESVNNSIPLCLGVEMSPLRQKARMKAIVSFQSRRHTATAQPCQTASFPQSSCTMEEFPGTNTSHPTRSKTETLQSYAKLLLSIANMHIQLCPEGTFNLQSWDKLRWPKKVVHGPPMLFHFERIVVVQCCARPGMIPVCPGHPSLLCGMTSAQRYQPCQLSSKCLHAEMRLIRDVYGKGGRILMKSILPWPGPPQRISHDKPPKRNSCNMLQWLQGHVLFQRFEDFFGPVFWLIPARFSVMSMISIYIIYMISYCFTNFIVERTYKLF